MENNLANFTQAIQTGYTFKTTGIVLGGAIYNGTVVPGTFVQAPLKMFNRHGLIAGATGTGKTKTLQHIAESLAQQGVSCLLMDIKGDLSGLAMPGTNNEKIADRSSKLGITWKPISFKTELMSISAEAGVKMRATVAEFGPVLFSKILELNDTQAGVVSLIFKYCDDNGLLLVDLKDFKKALQFLTNEGKAEIKGEYGSISTATASIILRKIIEIEQQGAEVFFGEKSFDVNDLMQLDENGFGTLNIIRLTDLQAKPKLFSTFMLSLMSEIYATFEEVGDAEAPKLCVFIDEAHLIFNEASKTLLNQLETMVKLIRSKGVGLYFITQIPTDVPASILSQLGLKVQHALRAFTAQDRKVIKATAENYPETVFYQTDELLTQVGIGEALVTVLNEKGNPTPLAHTMLCAPATRMDVLTPDEINNLVAKSALVKKYNQTIDAESAYEMLAKKIEAMTDETDIAENETKTVKEKEEKSVIETMANSTAGKQVLRTATSIITRGLLGALGISSTRTTRKKRNSWF
ncbi:MAG: DUF853 family protein [Bacteroidia bacterium]|nr:DUF853 family protein [Bacteroidia bacterium]